MPGVQLKPGVLAEHLECLHQAVHERLGELLRVLKAIISKHQRLNSVDILSTAGTVIATVKGEPAGARSPSGACARSSGRKTFLGDSSTSPLLCFLSLSKSLSRLDIFISET